MNRIAKGGFAAAGGLVGLLVISVAAIYGVSGSHLNQTFEVETPALTIPTDSASVAHGAHLLASRGCMDCHGDNLGGSIFIEDPAMGRLVATNLTAGAGGIGGTYAPEDWDRAIRHGVGPGGRALLFMPSYEFNHYSDDDIAAMIAYLRTVEPVDNEMPGNRVGPLARALYLKGDLPLIPATMIDHTPRERVAPEAGPTAEYGAYIAPGCMGCHGSGFSGGPIPGVPPDWPPSSNITMHETGLQGWTLEDFRRALKEGERPDGTELREPYMPIAVTSRLHDFEVEALWHYLQSVEPKPAGNR